MTNIPTPFDNTNLEHTSAALEALRELQTELAATKVELSAVKAEVSNIARKSRKTMGFFVLALIILVITGILFGFFPNDHGDKISEEIKNGVEEKIFTPSKIRKTEKKPEKEVHQLEPRVEQAKKVDESYYRLPGGSVVNQIGRPIRKGGKTFLPLFRDGKALMEPTDRQISVIQENMTFEGVRPPKGRLAVFDTILTPQGEVNVLAWEVTR